MMTSYPFSSQSVRCDPNVDHAAAARSAFAAGDYVEAIRHCFCGFMTSPVDLDMHMLNFQAMVRCGLHSSSALSEAVLDTLGNDRWEAIAQAARDTLASNPADEGAAAILARVAYLISPPSERAALIERLQAINPQNLLPLLLLGTDAATFHKDADEAKRLLEKAATQAPDDPEILCWVADLYVIPEVTKDLPYAISLYDKALRLNPELVMGYFARGMTHQELGDFAAAQADMDTALQFTPFDYRLHNVRAGLFKAQGDDAAALADFKRVLAINPASYTALKGIIELGVRLNSLADRKAATEAFVSSHILKPVEAVLTPDTSVRLLLSGRETGVVRLALAAGQQTIIVVEAAGEDSIFPAALLVAPDSGAVDFAHRIFDSSPIVKLSVTAPTAGDYTLMVIFSGLGEQELTVRME